jgi:myosin heavy subunit
MNRLHGRCLRSFLFCTQILSLVLLLGCADHSSRASGEALRKATADARKLYSQAHSILADPTRLGQGTAGEYFPAEALDLLNQAEKQLGSALANVTSADGEDMDLMLARQMLSMIRFLKGQYSYWTMQHFARAMQEQAVQSRLAIQQLVQLHSSPARQTGPTEQARAMKQQATKDRDAAQAELAQLDEQLKQLDAKKGDMQSDIDTKTSQAIKLRAQSRMRTTKAVDGRAASQERLKQLDEALALEQEVHRMQSELRALGEKKSTLQTHRTHVELARAGAQTKLDLLAQDAQKRSGSDSTTIDAERQKWTAQLTKSIEEMSRLSARLLQLSMEAETAYDKSAQSAREALALAPPTEKLSCILLQAEARTGMGNTHLLLWQIRSQVALVKDDLAGEARQVLGQRLPSFPAELETYMAETAQATGNGVTYFTDAVDLYNKAVSQASRAQRWRYQQGLAWAYLIQSQALAEQGETDRQYQARQKARDLLPDIQQGAKAAKQEDTIIPLQQRLAPAGA